MDIETKAPIKVRYKYIPRRVFGITNKNHVLYDGKLDSAIDKFSVLREASGNFRLEMTDADKEKIIEGLGLSENDLNIHNRNNEYLNTLSIEMPKSGLSLNIDNPYDLLIDKVLCAYDNVIAPNARSQKNKASFRYVRLVEDEETKILLEESDKKKKAYKLLGALEQSRERMILFLLNSKMRLTPSVTTPILRKLCNEAADKNAAQFISTLEDPLFIERGLVRMGAILKKINVISGLYYYKEEPLAFSGKPANLSNAAMYLKDTEQAELKLAISEEVIHEFGRTK